MKHAFKISSFFVALYAVCLAWKWMISDPVVAELHLNLLKLGLPGFAGFDAGSIVWGAALVAIYAFIGSLVFHAFHRNCCKGE